MRSIASRQRTADVRALVDLSRASPLALFSSLQEAFFSRLLARNLLEDLLHETVMDRRQPPRSLLHVFEVMTGRKRRVSKPNTSSSEGRRSDAAKKDSRNFVGCHIYRGGRSARTSTRRIKESFGCLCGFDIHALERLAGFKIKAFIKSTRSTSPLFL